ncbi:MAG TPA: glycoside hydrolase family 97 catalytic domain-containing protein [Candidatus Marinimicrobia bacterium]|nr:glycoside hydrolase family 97 catalytic domain-containing protein [Candidatus Neomarinimicrobiota bacterium]
MKIITLSFTALMTFSAFSVMKSCSGTNIVSHRLTSPDGNITVEFDVSQKGEATYQIAYHGKKIIQVSQLGLVREDADFSEGLKLDSVSTSCPINYDYRMPHGKKSHYAYSGNEKRFFLTNRNDQKIDVVFRASNDGVAYRYIFPDTADEPKTIAREISEFHFSPQAKAFIQPLAAAKSGWCQTNPSYEEIYQQNVAIDKLPFRAPGWVFPALFQDGDFWMLISETAPDRNYCGCRLQQDSTSHIFYIDFPQSAETFPGGVWLPTATLPWSTPWRIITIGKGLKNIVESTLGTDLAEPARFEEIDYVKPGRLSWSWVLLKDDSTVYEVQKRFIDYAAKMNWEYCLIDADWDWKIGYDKVAELAAYAQTKGVGILLWYNSSGDWNSTTYSPKSKLLTHNDRLREFARLKKMGIRGIKVDFFGGDGQSMMTYYQDIFEDAAQFGLVVNCHGATLPRGWQRTYPNLLTMEAVRGFEFITFDQADADREPTHACLLPFTRNVFDPIDFTPVCFSEIPNIRRVTTNGFELATSVIFWSGIQHFAEIPAGMALVPDYVRNFIREVPVSWDETCFIDGFPGQFVVLARKSGQNWYLAGINGADGARQLKLNCNFLEEDHTGQLITDAADGHSFMMKEIRVSPRSPLSIKLEKHGGFVIKFD